MTDPLPAHPDATERYANTDNLPQIVKTVLSTPAVHTTVLARESEGYNENESRIMALSGALSAALATEPALMGDLNEEQLMSMLNQVRVAKSEASALGASAHHMETLDFVETQLVDIHNDLLSVEYEY